MQQHDIYTQLTTIFHDLFDDDTIVLSPELTASDVPDWDSFNHINLIVAVESRFKIKFQTAELESMHTVGHLARRLAHSLQGYFRTILIEYPKPQGPVRLCRINHPSSALPHSVRKAAPKSSAPPSTSTT
jgi:acyl carrier protein